jgi:hypothetical protein
MYRARLLEVTRSLRSAVRPHITSGFSGSLAIVSRKSLAN